MWRREFVIHHSIFGRRVTGFIGLMWIAILLTMPAVGQDAIVQQNAVAESSATRSPTLAQRLTPYLDAISGKVSRFDLRGTLQVPIDGQSQEITLRLTRYGKKSFDLDLRHADYEVRLRRRNNATAFALPKHGVVFYGRGEVDDQDQLTPLGIVDRLITTRTAISTYAPMIITGDAASISAVLTSVLGVVFDPQTSQGSTGDIGFTFEPDGTLIAGTQEIQLRLSISAEPNVATEADSWSGLRVVEIPREEIERKLARGVRRALEIVSPSKLLTQPVKKDRQVEHGKLKWIGGQRVALLEGSPEEIGKAHGELLRWEAQACIDSVLYTFGTAQTIRTGRWFRHDLDDAYARLSPHIPERHKVETRAMARSLGMDEELVEALNVFPELFHCSGFAVFDSATKDGKLYHGRVLDYMTAIGLQDAATTFVIKADGQIPFVNVGYAAFIGSVSGMNARSISLGEMGGGGEGQWDGVPMATLMRRALEECSTLEEVMSLWEKSPRTCEYYYVFADGKTNRAVGVAAYPDSIEFIQPGESHARLGDGIKDAVVLSAGSRLEILRQRVNEKHGKIDADTAMWLMSRPVAMKSNLHNVLFVPQDGILYVANADHEHPAAERPYVRLDLNQLLGL